MKYRSKRSGFIFFEVIIALAAASMLLTATFQLLTTLMDRTSKSHYELEASQALWIYQLQKKFAHLQGTIEKPILLDLPATVFSIEEAVDKANFANIPGLHYSRLHVKDPTTNFQSIFMCALVYAPEKLAKKDSI